VLQHATKHDPAPKSGQTQRVLVLYEPGARGERALAQASEMVDREDAELTVVVLAPQDSVVCCGFGVALYNQVVRDEARAELREARRLLGAAASKAVFKVLVGHSDPSLPSWAASESFDVIVLPRHRRALRRAAHSSAAGLRRVTGADVRVVNE
jgi:hypothetical protein